MTQMRASNGFLQTSHVNDAPPSAATPRSPQAREGALRAMVENIGWAVRVTVGAMVASRGLASLGPLAPLFAHAAAGLHATWFAWAIGLALVASGVLLMTKKGVLLAMTLLIPVSMHFLFQWFLYGRSS